jgi:hypothetical protein
MTNPLFFMYVQALNSWKWSFAIRLNLLLFVKGLSYLLANEADVWLCNIEWERQKNAYR